HAAEVRTARKMSGPGRGDRVVAGYQRIDVVRHHTTCEPDGVLVVIAGALRSVTGRRVAVVEVVRCDDLIELLRVPLAVGGEVRPNGFLWGHDILPSDYERGA